jgi:hypothetical protein
VSAKRATVGDQFESTCHNVAGELVTTVVTAQAVKRLGCGCDEVSTIRPGGRLIPRDRMVLLPDSCHHGGIDFDVARERARIALEENA